LENAIKNSDTDKNIMTTIMNEIDVNVGDVYLIPARVIHAIGAGCLILEVQEPTDFTIEPERFCDDYRLSDSDMYLGLPKDIAIDCFSMSASGEDVIRLGKKNPELISDNENVKYEKLINENDTPCFSVNRLTVKKSCFLEKAPAIYVVTKGEGRLSGDDFSCEIKKGSYFFMPYSAKGKYEITADTEIEIVECFT